MGASDGVRREGGPSWGQNPRPSHRGSVLANEMWWQSFLGRGDPNGVEYTTFEVMGANNWTWREGGGWLEPKSQNLSHRGSVLAEETRGASVLGRGDLCGGREAKLRVGGVVL